MLLEGGDLPRRRVAPTSPVAGRKDRAENRSAQVVPVRRPHPGQRFHVVHVQQAVDK